MTGSLNRPYRSFWSRKRRGAFAPGPWLWFGITASTLRLDLGWGAVPGGTRRPPRAEGTTPRPDQGPARAGRGQRGEGAGLARRSQLGPEANDLFVPDDPGDVGGGLGRLLEDHLLLMLGAADGLTSQDP